jgi:hypothetical protein
MSMVEQQLWEEGRGSSKHEHGGEGAFFIGEKGAAPRGGVRQPLGENLVLFMVVTPSSWW